ncbi:hypothetical protein BGZ96_007882 [Linnemannia gamsii]|uniref:F-box domain-containing protein n=1 Tax=Linnemannia gamsii TaxID=64522 RepID=A0ABQ7K0K0_9FUNG|nr:hypothetical protein BGZ96_007882 [Linnemannia gamsii]
MPSQESSPFSIPEILLHVYSHLDEPALHTCARVSHFWRRWSLHHRSASAFVPSCEILDTFARRVVQDDSSDEEEEMEEEEAKNVTTVGQEHSSGSYIDQRPNCLQELTQRGPEVRSLTIGNRWNGGRPRMRANSSAYHWTTVIPPNLNNLQHIGFRLYSPEQFWAEENLRTQVMYGLLEQNPQVRSLEYSSYRAPRFSTLIDLLYRHPLQHLKRLDIQSRVTSEGFAELFVALIMRDRLQVQQRKAVSAINAGSLPKEPEAQKDPQIEPQTEPHTGVQIEPEQDSEPESGSGSGSESEPEQEPTTFILSAELLAELQAEDGEFAMPEVSEDSEEEVIVTRSYSNYGRKDKRRWLKRQYDGLDSATRRSLDKLPSLDLEELVIRNIGPINATRHLFDTFLRHCYHENRNRCQQSTLRRLTLLNFDLRHYLYNIRSRQREPDVDDGDPQVDYPILVHLCQRFQKLEYLCVSPDPSKIREPLPEPVRDRIRDTYPDLDNGGHIFIPARGMTGDDIVRLAPNLKAIDFSHHREMPSDDWDILLGNLCGQLESVVAWDVDDLGPRELLELVPPSPAIIATFRDGLRFQGWVGLQELDVSANPKLGSAVPMFLKYVPTLRILRALGVPINGSRLVEYDWVCTGLEVLSINIFIPAATFQPKITWIWNLDRDGWDVMPDPEDGQVDLSILLTSEGEKITGLAMGEQQQDLEDVDVGEQDKQGQEHVKSSCFDYSDSGESDSDLIDVDGKTRKAREEDEAYQRWRAKEDKRIEATTTYSTQIQRQICQQLGRMTELRQLTLEGYHSDHGDKEANFIDCLHLTLESGLDYLRPLRKNLEKLVVYQLDEELCGRAEMEWIAQNWVNYANGPWQKGYREWKAAKGKPVLTNLELIQEMPWGPAEDPLIPAAAFKELLGIGVRGVACGGRRSESRANGNVAWLQRQCPRLVVVKEDASQPKVRSTFDPYYFAL